MKIIVISSVYPPYYIGGYELGCWEVVEGLKAKGHKVKVLTSKYGIGKPENNGEVFRWLASDFSWESKNYSTPFKLLIKEIKNQSAFNRLCSQFKPDIVYLWSLSGISISLVFKAQKRGLPVSFAISDKWLSYWEIDKWYSLCNRQPYHLLKKILWKIVRIFLSISGLLITSEKIDLRNVHFISKYIQNEYLKTDKKISDSKVIYRGVYINQFPYTEHPDYPRRLLYVGQIVPHKGVHTVIEAFNIIIKKSKYDSIKLTLVGGTVFPDYKAKIKQMVYSFGLENYVNFTGQVPYKDLPSYYKEHDILIFPSIWDEPLSHTVLEAMSSGLAVVSTATGGTPEVLQDEFNALIFPKEDAKACANQVMRLMDSPELFKKIQQNGLLTIKENFRSETRVDKIEKALQEAIENYTPYL